MKNLTKEEQNAINSLRRLIKRWPKSLELFSNSGALEIRRKGWCDIEEWSDELIDKYLVGSFYDKIDNGGSIDEKYVPSNTYCM